MYRQVCVLKNNSSQLCQLQQLRSISQTLEKVSDENSARKQEWEQAKPFKAIPGPTKYEFIRSFFPGGMFYKMPIYDFIYKTREMYGDLYVLSGFFGGPNTLMAFNPDDFLTVLRAEGVWPHRRGLATMKYYRTVHRKEEFGDVIGLIGSNEEDWGKLRSTVNPILMQPKNAKLYLNNMLEVNDEFLQRIREIRDPKTLEMPESFEDEINRLTFESVAVIALNRQLGLIRKNRNDEEAKLLFESLRSFFELSLVLDFGPSIWKYYKTKQFHQQMKNYDIQREISTKYINEAIERIENDKTPRKDNEEKSVLEKLLKIDKKVAKVMALDLMTAGVDTTSSTLAGILLAIAKNPDKQEKLRQEICTILPQKDSRLTIDNMKNLPYLRACIKEGMRIYPIGGGTIRTIKEDIVMSGYQIPKGQEIILSHNIMLNTEQFCPKAKEFIPERWLRSEDSKYAIMHPFLFMPFSHGPRSCVGKRIVEMELEITVARLVRNFYIEFNYSTENAFKNRLINVPAIPLKFKFSEVEQKFK
ncbi:cytochrome P450 CYP12A2-like [Episyrphus balteatus]|uniref:cytochrome P450 CYP12A2-like n=1 Tax=Episyrphus balteatus TaxID=286459 RepID=UPI002486A056|nr:cytochrome P450 CYP12A2-like [Episyrphus balteatus]